MAEEREQAEQAQHVVNQGPGAPQGPIRLPTICAQQRAQPSFLYQLPFSKHEEALLERIIVAEHASRDQVLERLWERAVVSLIVAEAEKVLEEMHGPDCEHPGK
jgi:hypothetical protein